MLLSKTKTKSKAKAWVVAVTMGYGHLRAANPLRGMADGHYLLADDYPGMPAGDRGIWKEQQEILRDHLAFSRHTLDRKTDLFHPRRLAALPQFYPRRDLSAPTFPVRQAYSFFREGFMKHFVKMIAAEPLPLVTSFYYVAQAAEFHNYPNEIYCIICDSDMSRSWVALEPKKSRIKYFAPNRRVSERLKNTAFPEANIFITGFPLPKKLIGGLDHKILKQDIAHRLANLDTTAYTKSVSGRRCKNSWATRIIPGHNGHPLTLAFAVGGAGAQRKWPCPYSESLKAQVKDGRDEGDTHRRQPARGCDYFEDGHQTNRIVGHSRIRFEVLVGKNQTGIFRSFNEAMRRSTPMDKAVRTLF